MSFAAQDADQLSAKADGPYDEFCQQIYEALLAGNLIKIRSHISRRRVSKEEGKRIFESNTIAIQSNVGNECAPAIVIASKYGHTKIVHFLIKEYNVDLNKPGNVKFDGFLIEGATALWCAAGAGHMEIIRCLVENGAQVNKTTNSNSTPLRAACFDGRLDIVRYLVQHKADIEIPNRYRNNCLMISAFRGHLAVVNFLLECGMNPNQTAMANATALQFAAETGRTEICRALIHHGAKLSVNDSGLDQLFVAAEHAQAETVMYMVLEPKLEITRRHHIEALELLGAMMLNDKDRYDPVGAYRLLVQALRMRTDPDAPEPKTSAKPIAAYRMRKECETLAELEEIQYDFELLELEGLMIRERVLGPQYCDLTGPIVYRGAVCADLMQFNRCLELWLHALRLRHGQNQAGGKDLLRLSQVLSQMVSLRAEVPFRIVYEVLTISCEELHRCRLRCKNQREELDAFSQDVHTVFYLLALLSKVKMTIYEEQLSFRLVHSLVKADFRLPNGHSLLHMSCDPATEIDSFHVSSAVSVPNCTVAKLLLHCGADPNAMSDAGDTPLHLIVRYDRALPDFLTLESTITCLVTHGAHTDVRNCHGQRPQDVAPPAQSGEQSVGEGGGGLAALVLSGCGQQRLMCLAAEAVAKHWLPIICARSHKPETDCCQAANTAGDLAEAAAATVATGFHLPPGLLQFVGLHSQHRQACRRCRPAAVGIGPGQPNRCLRSLTLAAASVAKGDSSSSKSLSAQSVRLADVDMRSDGRLQ
ncbi:hypothetical protein BOX15_Mlig027157g2 [Macrostomum lignano]|uniref:ANK_REP_REGION domain-containing protein n=1 Tax=Macrostomum lignano TaxID=282301 RepID=A0A267EWB5_9PLAT|nr:hypothetical protein BOX15_Mlig027157g2 [Macrostomum lignano]